VANIAAYYERPFQKMARKAAIQWALYQDLRYRNDEAYGRGFEAEKVEKYQVSVPTSLLK
jgi:hypothetical protein